MHVRVQFEAPPPPAAASQSHTDFIDLGVMVYMSKVGEMHFPTVRTVNLKP